MMPGGDVDGLVLLMVGGVLAAALAIAFRARPALAVVTWLGTVAFVPYWLGVSLGPYVPPATAVAAIAVAALTARRPLYLRAPDVVMAAVVLITVAAYALDYVTIHALVVVVMDWGAAYLFARLVTTSVDAVWVYGAVALVMGAAAALAVVEFVAGFNPWVLLPAVGGGPTGWQGLQERGGILRAEGAFGHSIALGASLALALPLTLGSRLRSGVKLAVVALLLIGATVSFSRIGIGSSVMGLVLCIVLLRNGLRTGVRAALAVALGVGALVALPLVGRVFDAAGQEAAGSAQYRGDLLVLVPTMRFIGTATSAERSADGVLRFGGFRSIDSAVIYAGLTYGLLVTGLLCLLYLAAMATLLRGNPDPPTLALAAQLPAVVSVAFITQYSAFFWFVAGLAVSAYAARVISGPEGPRAPLRARPLPTLVRPGPATVTASHPSALEGAHRRRQ